MTAIRIGIKKSLKMQGKQIKQLTKQPFLLTLILLILIFFFVFAVYPIFQVLKIAISGEEGFSLSNLKEMITNHAFLRALWNSIRLGIISAVLGTAVGFLFAFAITRTEMRGKKFFHLMALLPIISPPFVIALSMILLFGKNGAISNGIFHLANSNIYGMGSLIFIQTLAFFPIAYMNLRGVLESIDPSLEDAALNMGASRWKVFKTITFPLALPGVFSALLLVFIKSIEDFGNPMIIAGDYETLAVQAYLQIIGMYNLSSGAFFALALLIPAFTAFLIQKYWLSKKSYVTVTGKPSQSTIKINEKYIVYPLFVLCILATGTILLFYGSVAFGSLVKVWGIDHTFTLDNFKYVFTLGFDSIKNSLLLATISTPITAILGMIIAYLIIRKQFIGKKLLELSTMLPFAVPGTVVGIGFILAFNEKPLALTGTAFILIITFTVRNITTGIEAGTNSLRQVDPSIEEASTNLGANGIQTFFKVSLPLMRSALFSGLVYSFVKSMTSISAVIFLVSVHWNLITVSILSQVEGSRMGAAAAYVMILIIIVLIAIGILQLVVNKLGPAKRRK
ncbi:iron(III) transport system permease protein [Virgibacillus halotolerans]|uniref:ABC transporter permease n=1 Tax=Virgibacillus halotolerans TaxID=1071053 RepID=UPI001EF7663D|nr:iron ABC transporter permease [Virgibacillus halotolerans]MBM7600080.1 iron(III) transport system permease protein [Virgibacillus halotolerans]